MIILRMTKTMMVLVVLARDDSDGDRDGDRYDEEEDVDNDEKEDTPVSPSIATVEGTTGKTRVLQHRSTHGTNQSTEVHSFALCDSSCLRLPSPCSTR